MTLHVAVLLPSTVVTVTVASPALYAVTSPLSSTDATASLLLDHVTFRFVALWGVTVVVSTSLPPTGSVRLDLFRLTPVTEVTGGGGTAAAVTFICTDAVFAPSTVVTVTVVSPALYAVTSPLSSTDATASLLLDHVTFRFVALWGVTVVVSTSLPPTGSVRLDLFRLTPVTEVTGGGGTAAAVTFICTDAVFAPSTVVTVTVA